MNNRLKNASSMQPEAQETQVHSVNARGSEDCLLINTALSALPFFSSKGRPKTGFVNDNKELQAYNDNHS